MQILTVTPNVAIDQTVYLDHLIPGAVHRAKSVMSNAGGKGVNVASCLADWDIGVTVSGFLGRDNASIFEDLCTAKGLRDEFIRVDGSSRTNVKLVDETDTTDINLPGAPVDAGAVSSLEARVAAFGAGAERDGLAFLCGSLPPGCPEDIYPSLMMLLNKTGCKVLLDASEKALSLALEGKAMPYAVKPNRDELGAWAGEALDTHTKLAGAVHRLHDKGVALVTVSLGEQGALFSDGRQSLYAKLRAERVTGTTGAGDAMVAGIGAALAENAGLERLARLATAFAVGKLSLLGPNLPPRAQVESLAAMVDIRKA